MEGVNQLTAAVGEAISASESLNGNLAALLAAMTNEEGVLEIASQIESGLSDVGDLLRMAQATLEIITIVPDIGEIAAPFVDAVGALALEVSDAKWMAQAVAAELIPFVDALQSAMSSVKSSSGAIDAGQQVLGSFQPQFDAILDSINNMQNGTEKSEQLQEVGEFCRNVTPRLVQLTGLMTSAGAEAAASQGQLNSLGIMSQLTQALGSFQQAFGPVQAEMVTLEKSLRSIEITVYVPDPETITLYQVFQDFEDFEGAIEQAMAPINHLVNEVIAPAIKHYLPQIPLINEFKQMSVPQDVGFNDLLNELGPIASQLIEVTDMLQAFVQYEQPGSK